ncbi:Sir2 family NAD-dependent protein deacetylase [Propionibacterium australiense]|uniref:protein acetyllysine N-acetyltransferase n=1 Tax=Propionibacterium australiense TaxID=119981 RepID=A0A383S460_9ACTN|nr:Sir2 family NAD-dependent protein deacetylase [Propionibacterium australiense]RLP10590.1 NAD-dependent deacetylase [Propionibacterium australiense]RLP12886.1 NAD-dependent deacetylase [Propionibacterium australiense]SYZ32790.1 Sirtuin family [Propionibacterium australiense]VEH91248.1 NAD-dependent deacetylase [Propionibacterium australiense]
MTDAPTAGIRLHARQATSGWQPSTHVHGTVEQARELLGGRQAVVLTGAGMSTASGVPDYRGPRAVRATPILYGEFLADPATRRRYWARNYRGWASLDRAEPNEAHHALSRWEHQDTVGPMIGIISQNVDGLHEAAGSRQLITLHGRSADVVCLGCGRIMARRALQDRMAELNPAVPAADDVVQAELRPDADAEVEDWQDFVVPDCPWCGGLLKPDVVFFGEPVPRARVVSAFAWCDAAEVMLVAGSSLTVMSGLRFVRAMARAGKPVIVINHGATRADELAAVRLDEPLTQVLPRLLAPAS